MFTSSEFRGPFFRVLAWNLVFALASVVVTFALGLLLAVVFNDVRMRGRKLYRSLIIIPYALPGFMTALVWKGMFNETFGINKWLPFHVSWQSSTVVAMLSLILVNMWLGYPYMFLVSTGALQSVPADLKEAAFVDGATGWKAFRKITFPLLLVSVSPLLVASFAFNFNNFTLVYLLTGGIPAQDRRERRDDRHPDDVGLPRRPRRQPAAPGPGRRPLGDDLPDRRRDLGGRVQVHQGLRGGASEHRRRYVRRGHLLGRQVFPRPGWSRSFSDPTSRTSANAGGRSADGSARPGGGTSSGCWPCSSPSSRSGSWSSPPSRRAPR